MAQCGWMFGGGGGTNKLESSILISDKINRNSDILLTSLANYPTILAKYPTAQKVPTNW